MTEVKEEDEAATKAFGIFIRLALPPYTIHFKSPSYMKEATLDMLDRRVCKETLRATGQKARVRCVLHSLVMLCCSSDCSQRSYWDQPKVLG